MTHPKYKHLEAFDPYIEYETENHFEVIDPIIDEWVAAHKLNLGLMDRGYQARQVRVGDKLINIPFPTLSGVTCVMVLDLVDGAQIHNVAADKTNLREMLDHALNIAKGLH